MTPPPQLQVRATDADRDRVAEMLRAAAGQGALSIDELEERLSAAYAAVTRADLVGLVSDLSRETAPPPPLHASPAPPLGASRKASLFWVWGLVPWLGAAAWVHAGFLTRSTRHWLLAAVYAIPLALAVVAAPGAEDEVPGWVVGVAIAFWIVNAIHAWLDRSTVEAAQARARSGRRRSAV